jgi:hypothetical protein
VRISHHDPTKNNVQPAPRRDAHALRPAIYRYTDAVRVDAFVLGCLAACASTAAPAPTSPVDVTAGVAPAAGAAPAVAPAAPETAIAEAPRERPVCRVQPEPVIAAPAVRKGCPQVAKQVQGDLRPRLERAFRPTAPGATLAIRYACDPVGEVWELVFETGTGHGHGLALVRLRWRDRTIAGLRISRDGRGEVRVERAEVERVDVDRALPGLRGLLLAQLEERVPPDPRGGAAHGGSGSWHAALRLADSAGHVDERGFTGSDSSVDQLHSIPVAEISATMRPLVDAMAWQPAAVDDDARAFFASRFVAAVPDRAAWWVKERLVALAAVVGTPALIPRLIALAQDIRVDASVQRTREHALIALAALAGFDARYDAQGAPVGDDVAAATYAAACGP